MLSVFAHVIASTLVISTRHLVVKPSQVALLEWDFLQHLRQNLVSYLQVAAAAFAACGPNLYRLALCVMQCCKTGCVNLDKQLNAGCRLG